MWSLRNDNAHMWSLRHHNNDMLSLGHGTSTSYPSDRTWPSLQWRHNDRHGISKHQPHDCLLNRLFRHRSKKTSKFRVTGLCEGNSPVTGEFPTQRASKAENVSIWWRHHEMRLPHVIPHRWDITQTTYVISIAPSHIHPKTSRKTPGRDMGVFLWFSSLIKTTFLSLPNFKQNLVISDHGISWFFL